MNLRLLLVFVLAAAALLAAARFALDGNRDAPHSAQPEAVRPARVVVEDSTPVVAIAEPEPQPEPTPQPDPVPVARGSQVEFVEPPVQERVERTRDNSTRTQLQAELQLAEDELARRKELLGKAEWSKGQWREHEPGQGMPRPQQSWDGVPEELYWRRARNAQGGPVLRVVSLPFDLYPEYYDLKREALRLRDELRNLETPD